MTTAQQTSQPRQLTPHELAGVVRAFREMRHWSQEQLAEIARLSTRTVQRVEEGLPSSTDTRRALASAFDADDIDWLNKPYMVPTAEELVEAAARFEKENVTLKASLIETGKQLGKLAESTSASLFSEKTPLSAKAEALFAQLTDYCRDYADCQDAYSAIDKLTVYEELGSLLAGLAEEDVSLVGATRDAKLSAGEAENGIDASILYIVACARGEEPGLLTAPRIVRFG